LYAEEQIGMTKVEKSESKDQLQKVADDGNLKHAEELLDLEEEAMQFIRRHEKILDKKLLKHARQHTKTKVCTINRC
jgi:hypothetical protein